MGTIAARAESLLAAAVVATTPVAGGDVCTAIRLRLSDGRSAFLKTRAHAPTEFFATEARGLRWLADAPGGAPVPDVLAVAEDCLILSWVEVSAPTADAAERFGRELAATHRAGADAFGATEDGFIGSLPLPNAAKADWAEFWVTRRVQPYVKAASDRGALDSRDRASIEAVLDRVADLAGPPEPPARVHGDLWAGNLLWNTTGAVTLVDPAAHGGHRETDVAMLALFGAPHLPRILDSYREAFPLSDGWEERLPLHHLHPLLVHTTLFGGGYGVRAGQAARALLSGAAAEPT